MGRKISIKISVIISLGHYYMELQYQFMNAYCCIILSIKYLGRGHFIFIRRTKSPSFPLPESILYGPIPCEVSQVPSNNHKLQISQMAWVPAQINVIIYKQQIKINISHSPFALVIWKLKKSATCYWGEVLYYCIFIGFKPKGWGTKSAM